MNILIMGGRRDVPSAITICMDNIGYEFRSRGDDVWMINYSKDDKFFYDEETGIHKQEVHHNIYTSILEYRVNNQSALSSLLFRIVTIIRHILLLPFFPNVAPFCSIRVYRSVKRIVSENKIDLLICPYHNYENIYAGIRIKKEFGHKIKVITYHLDLRTATGIRNTLVRGFIHNRVFRSIVEESNSVDKILVPYSGKEEFIGIKDVDLKKVSFVGFPVFIPEKELMKECDLPFEEDCINISYIGSLSFSNRSPKYFLDILEKIEEEHNMRIKVHFWGYIEDPGIESMLNASPVANYYGIIHNKYARYIMSKSDYVLNIGNTITPDLLPSKLFSIFALGKPIINIVNNPKDLSQLYIRKYGNSIDIYAYQNCMKKDKKTFIEGINKKVSVNLIEIEEIFKDFTPQFICDIITEV